MRQSCEVENLMTSVERILEYTALESEPLDTGIEKPNSKWPHSGHIKFDDVYFSYAKNLPLVLNGLSFDIKPKEKIGVVGRTGAGKSSIIQALFRMTEPNGLILIDGVNTKNLSLHDLRKNISIIPVRIFFVYYETSPHEIINLVLLKCYLILNSKSQQYLLVQSVQI